LVSSYLVQSFAAFASAWVTAGFLRKAGRCKRRLKVRGGMRTRRDTSGPRQSQPITLTTNIIRRVKPHHVADRCFDVGTVFSACTMIWLGCGCCWTCSPNSCCRRIPGTAAISNYAPSFRAAHTGKRNACAHRPIWITRPRQPRSTHNASSKAAVGGSLLRYAQRYCPARRRSFHQVFSLCFTTAAFENPCRK